MKITRSLSAIIVTILIAALPVAAPAQFSVGVGFTVGQPPPPLPVVLAAPGTVSELHVDPGLLGMGLGRLLSGFPAPGSLRRPSACTGRPATGAPPAAASAGTPATGAPPSASTAASTTVLGYPGTGFYGGSWNGGNFGYNTAVTNVNTNVIHNTYNKTVINKNVCNNCKNVSLQRRQRRNQRQTDSSANQLAQERQSAHDRAERTGDYRRSRSQPARLGQQGQAVRNVFAAGRSTTTTNRRTSRRSRRPTSRPQRRFPRGATTPRTTRRRRRKTNRRQNNKRQCHDQNKPAANQNKAANPAHASAQNRPGTNNKISSATQPASQAQHNTAATIRPGRTSSNRITR